MTRLLPILFYFCSRLVPEEAASPLASLSRRSGRRPFSPPWEALIAAGPGASKEIDLETLNGPGKQQAAVAETPEQLAADAKSGRLVIRAVAVIPVKGAKGTGNDELTHAMRQTLTTGGLESAQAPAKNALTISGRVEMAEVSGATQMVALKWAVQAPDGGKARRC